MPGAPPETVTPARVRARRRRPPVVPLIAALLATSLWWTHSDDPRGDVLAIGDPVTYRQLAADMARLLDDFANGGVVVAGPNQIAVTAPAVDGSRSTPPIGVDEADARLSPSVPPELQDPAYRFAATQEDGLTPVAWSPCRPIRYVVNDDGAPDGFAAAVDEAIAEVAAATGLVFVDEGETGEEPSTDRGAYLPDEYGDRWAPVLIAVSDPGSIEFLEGETAGVAYTYRVRGVRTGLWHLVSGSIYLDRDAFDLSPDMHGDPGWGAVLRHELGHLVGLDHLDDPTQLMNPVTSSAVHAYQDGDLTGLAILGQGECAPDV